MSDERIDWANERVNERLCDLAEALHDLAYGRGTWAIADDDIRANYFADARDVIAAMPHLLHGEDRETAGTLSVVQGGWLSK